MQKEREGQGGRKRGGKIRRRGKMRQREMVGIKKLNRERGESMCGFWRFEEFDLH